MTSAEAKQVLLLYRPGTRDAADPEIAVAMSVAKEDPELGRWFEEHQVFQVAMRAKLRQIEAPESLKLRLLAGAIVVRPPSWWRQPAALAWAAVFVVLAGLSVLWLRPTVPDRFVNFQEMMVSRASRVAYSMDWPTNDMHALRQAFAGRGAPADYQVPKGLEQLHLTGGAALTWRSHPVSMVCFERQDKKMVFLFVTERHAVKNPPPEQPFEKTISSFATVSWSRGDKTYLLAAPPATISPKSYL